MWVYRFLDGLRQDLGYGARTCWKTPGFAVVAVLTLALGIGVNAAVFTIPFIGVSLFLVAVALLACWLPARRAAKLDPTIALKCD